MLPSDKSPENSNGSHEIAELDLENLGLDLDLDLELDLDLDQDRDLEIDSKLRSRSKSSRPAERSSDGPKYPSKRPDILETTDILVLKNNVSHLTSEVNEQPNLHISYPKNDYCLDKIMAPTLEGKPLSSQNIEDDDSFVIYQDDSQGDNESILGQFESYFRRKIDTELGAFQESMHTMLSEQQVHVRNILMTMQMNPEREIQGKHQLSLGMTSVKSRDL